MPTPSQPSKLRAFFAFAGRTTPCYPVGVDGQKLTRTPDETGFYMRDKLAKPFVFQGTDFAFLWTLENSADRCSPLALILEAYDEKKRLYRFVYRGSFTLSECKWDPYNCSVEVPLVTDDPYRQLLESWDKEYNLLAAPGFRTLATSQFDTLQSGIEFDFKRIDKDEEFNEVGSNGWAVFLRNNSWITGSGASKGVRDRTIILFRLIRRNVPYELQANGTYLPPDLTESGFYRVGENDQLRVADYAREPQITGFKPFLIGSIGDWTPGRWHVYGDKLLLLGCGEAPTPYEDYVEVTGQGRANNAECYDTCLNIRSYTDDENCRSLWWRFGYFEFRRNIRLLDAVHYLLSVTAPALCPPQSGMLSEFFSSPVNYVTGATGEQNELPDLVVAAASDIKRSTASEPATRLLISLKVLLTDLCTAFDCGYFIDPTTGFLRLEHRKWRESQALSPIDLLSEEHINRTRNKTQYSYTTQKAPAEQVLVSNNAVTDSFQPSQVSYTDARIVYEGNCVNTREGENSSTASLSRLTTDLPGLLLNGDSISDQALVLLAPSPSGVIPNANARVSLSNLVRNYHTYGRVRAAGIVDGLPKVFNSRKPTRQQQPFSVCLPLEQVTAQSRFATQISSQGEVVTAEWDPQTNLVTLTLVHPAPDDATAPSSGLGRQFTDQFSTQFA